MSSRDSLTRLWVVLDTDASVIGVFTCYNDAYVAGCSLGRSFIVVGVVQNAVYEAGATDVTFSK